MEICLAFWYVACCSDGGLCHPRQLGEEKNVNKNNRFIKLYCEFIIAQYGGSRVIWKVISQSDWPRRQLAAILELNRLLGSADVNGLHERFSFI